MQRQGGGACYTAEGVIVEGTCRAPIPTLKGGASVPGGCIEGQCGLPVISGGGCGCSRSVLSGGRRRRANRKNRRNTRRNRRNNRKNTRRAH